jgi:hypothetical protein
MAVMRSIGEEIDRNKLLVASVNHSLWAVSTLLASCEKLIVMIFLLVKVY